MRKMKKIDFFVVSKFPTQFFILNQTFEDRFLRKRDSPLDRIIHEINFEAILGTSLKGIYVYFAGLVTTNRSKLTQNLSPTWTP